MGLPGFDVEGNPEPGKKRGEYDHVARQLLGPEKVTFVKKNMWTAVLMQAVFFYVGAGYFYLGERRKCLTSAMAFILGIVAILYLEMTVFPTEAQFNQQLIPLHYLAVAIALCLGVAVYPSTVYDCYRIGKASEKRARGLGTDGEKQRKLTPDERIEQLVSEHDKASD
jgi:hypothetical protein